jgi:hypothetical protein
MRRCFARWSWMGMRILSARYYAARKKKNQRRAGAYSPEKAILRKSFRLRGNKRAYREARVTVRPADDIDRPLARLEVPELARLQTDCRRVGSERVELGRQLAIYLLKRNHVLLETRPQCGKLHACGDAGPSPQEDTETVDDKSDIECECNTCSAAHICNNGRLALYLERRLSGTPYMRGFCTYINRHACGILTSKSWRNSIF